MWIIQEKIFGDETDKLIKALWSNDVPYTVLKTNESIHFRKGDIVRGSIDFVQNMELFNNLTVDILNLKNYTYSKYTEYFGELMLNDDFIIMPWWALYTQFPLIFDAFPNSQRFFIRPDSGKKLFTGTTLTKKWFLKELNIIESLPNSSVNSSDLVIISTAKEIYAEYRCLMYKNKVIAYSQYEGESSLLDTEIIKYCTGAIAFYPDSLYTIDIGITSCGPKIIELNSFYSAGLYDMDFDKVVKFIKEMY